MSVLTKSYSVDDGYYRLIRAKGDPEPEPGVNDFIQRENTADAGNSYYNDDLLNTLYAKLIDNDNKVDDNPQQEKELVSKRSKKFHIFMILILTLSIFVERGCFVVSIRKTRGYS